MKEIFDTTQLEFDKSAFLIELVKHDNGLPYIEIIQTIYQSRKNDQTIKINPSILTDIIRVLQNYHAKIENGSISVTKHLTEEGKQKIQDSYLKGVSVKDLALQLNQSEELIKMILRNKGISIVSQELPKRKRGRRRGNR